MIRGLRSQRRRERRRVLKLMNLIKHLFVCGMPGTGKSTVILGMLFQCFLQDIPCILLDPIKRESRALKRLKNHADPEIRAFGEAPRYYTPGNDKVSPYRMNPVAIPAYASRDEHIEAVIRIFYAAVPLPAPLPFILGEALEMLYDNHPDPAQPPTMADLADCVEKVVAGKSYSREISGNILGALQTRLSELTRRQMGRIFQCPQCIHPVQEDFTGWTVYELGNLSQEQAALFTLFKLTAIGEYLKTLPTAVDKPRLVVIIEEAHLLVGRNTDTTPSESFADPQASASHMVERMLAEWRAKGVGVVILDQHPSAVASEVIKGTSAKLAFRQVEQDDRETLANAMCCTDYESERMPQLGVGEAFLFREGDYRPVLISTIDWAEELGLEPELGDEDFRALIEEEPFFQEAARKRAWAELNRLLTQLNRFDEELDRDARQVNRLLHAEQAIRRRASNGGADKALDGLAARGEALRREIAESYAASIRRPYQSMMGDHDAGVLSDEDLAALRAHVVDRYESGVEPGVEVITKRLDGLVERCQGDDK